MVETIWVDGPHCSMTPQNPRLYAAPLSVWWDIRVAWRDGFGLTAGRQLATETKLTVP